MQKNAMYSAPVTRNNSKVEHPREQQVTKSPETLRRRHRAAEILVQLPKSKRMEAVLQAARIFGVGVSAVHEWMTKVRKNVDLKPSGRPSLVRNFTTRIMNENKRNNASYTLEGIPDQLRASVGNGRQVNHHLNTI